MDKRDLGVRQEEQGQGIIMRFEKGCLIEEVWADRRLQTWHQIQPEGMEIIILSYSSLDFIERSWQPKSLVR